MQQPPSESRPDAAPPALRLTARNTSPDSENVIHSDAHALQYGYRGGLVPGVTLYAYLTQLAVRFYGAAWLARGTADFTARRPVYDGETIRAEGTVRPRDGATPQLELAIVREGEPQCAGGTFGLEDTAATLAPIPAGPPPPDPLPLLTPEQGPPVGVPLAPLHSPFAVEDAAAYADLTDDPNPWYRGPSPFGGPLVPPGWLALRQTPLLRANFRLAGPSIHVRSVVLHLAPAFAGRTYTTRGVIRETFERRGNHYLVLDAETRDDENRAVCRVEHTWIWHVRPAPPGVTGSQGG
jgi:acyl dehydratase